MHAPFSAADWQAIADRAVSDLQDLLRIPTVNPPGNEGPAADWIEARLREEGIEVVRLECEGRPNLVARLPGSGGGGGPLLLTGHMDVVPVEREHWTHDPFGGEIHGGYLWGRGAIDMKNMVVMSMTMLLLMKRAGLTPARDLIFAAVSDEEEGCTHGSRFLVEEHPDLVRAEYMIGEIGGFSQDINGIRYYPVQVGEKGMARIRLRATGSPGHGSIPHQDNALVKLGVALTLLGNCRLPVHLTASAQAFLQELAKTQKSPAKHVLPLLGRPLLTNLILDRVLPDRSLANTLAANLTNTVSPTVLQAGEKVNQIPSHAEAMLDGRILPGQTEQDLLRELRAVIGDDLEMEVVHSFRGREDTTDDPLFRMICDTLRRHDPEGHPLPTLIPGFTDAQYFHRLGARCYGFSPLRFPKEDDIRFSALFHGHDERIHVEGYRWGLACLWDLVRTFTDAR